VGQNLEKKTDFKSKFGRIQKKFWQYGAEISAELLSKEKENLVWSSLMGRVRQESRKLRMKGSTLTESLRKVLIIMF